MEVLALFSRILLYDILLLATALYWIILSRVVWILQSNIFQVMGLPHYYHVYGMEILTPFSRILLYDILLLILYLQDYYSE